MPQAEGPGVAFKRSSRMAAAIPAVVLWKGWLRWTNATGISRQTPSAGPRSFRWNQGRLKAIPGSCARQETSFTPLPARFPDITPGESHPFPGGAMLYSRPSCHARLRSEAAISGQPAHPKTSGVPTRLITSFSGGQSGMSMPLTFTSASVPAFTVMFDPPASMPPGPNSTVSGTCRSPLLHATGAGAGCCF